MPTRALVLGGGGPVGIAWESGLAYGLEEGGVRIADADFIMGTSAGSSVGAQLALGRTAASLYGSATRPAVGAPAKEAEAKGAPQLGPLMDLMRKAVAGEVPAQEVRREIGAYALSVPTIAEEDFINGFGSLIAGAAEWPETRYAATACDAETGEFVTWEKKDNVRLGAAVASSCSVPGIYPPITINGRRYIDGGMRSGTNADVAAGYAKVMVIAVSAGADTPLAEIARRSLDGELKTLKESGSDVELIVPDAGSAKAFGNNLMDYSRRKDAAEAGYAQGLAEAPRLMAFWE